MTESIMALPESQHFYHMFWQLYADGEQIYLIGASYVLRWNGSEWKVWPRFKEERRILLQLAQTGPSIRLCPRHWPLSTRWRHLHSDCRRNTGSRLWYYQYTLCDRATRASLRHHQKRLLLSERWTIHCGSFRNPPDAAADHGIPLTAVQKRKSTHLHFQ